VAQDSTQTVAIGFGIIDTIPEQPGDREVEMVASLPLGR
jgi:hypothetical protein